MEELKRLIQDILREMDDELLIANNKNSVRKRAIENIRKLIEE